MNYSHDNLLGGTRARIRKIQARIIPINARREKIGNPPLTWKDAYRPACGSTDAHGMSISKNGEYASIPASVLDGFRDCGSAPAILGRRYGGWYADAFQNETYVGNVWQLPARDGTPFYIAGYVEKQSGYAVLECSRGRIAHFHQKESAARAADELARIQAEKQRESDEYYQSECKALEEKDDAKTAVFELLKAIRDQRKTGPLSPVMKQRVFDELENARDQWKKYLTEWIDAAAAYRKWG